MWIRLSRKTNIRTLSLRSSAVRPNKKLVFLKSYQSSCQMLIAKRHIRAFCPNYQIIDNKPRIAQVQISVCTFVLLRAPEQHRKPLSPIASTSIINSTFYQNENILFIQFRVVFSSANTFCISCYNYSEFLRKSFYILGFYR